MDPDELELVLENEPEPDSDEETGLSVREEIVAYQPGTIRSPEEQLAALRTQALTADAVELLRQKALQSLARGGDIMMVKMGNGYRLQVAGAERIARLLGLLVSPADPVPEEFGICGKNNDIYQATYRVTVTDPYTGQSITREGHADTEHGLLAGKDARDGHIRALIRNSAESRAFTKAVGHLTGLLSISPAELQAAGIGTGNVSRVDYRGGRADAS